METLFFLSILNRVDEEREVEKMDDVIKYLEKVCNGALAGANPYLALLWSGISYVLFPDKAYFSAAIALGGAMILDIITKYYALSRPHGSVRKAMKEGDISSDSFFRGTFKKLVSFLTLMTLCGLSIRVTPVAAIAVFFSTLTYAVMFLREAQSCIENLIQAGHHDLEWMLPVLKKKEESILGKEGIDRPSNSGNDGAKG